MDVAETEGTKCLSFHRKREQGEESQELVPYFFCHYYRTKPRGCISMKEAVRILQNGCKICKIYAALLKCIFKEN